MGKEVAVIVAKHYGEVEAFLAKSPIVQRMLLDLGAVPLCDMANEQGEATWDFMLKASREYDRLSALNPDVAQPASQHIGAVAAALIHERVATIKAFVDIATDDSKPEGVKLILQTLRDLEAKYVEQGETSGLVADVRAAGVVV